MMMAVVNIGSLLEYGRPTAVLKQISGIVPAIPPLPKSRTSSKKEERRDSDRMDVDAEEEDIKMAGVTSSPVITKAEPDVDGDLPVHLKLSLQLTFSMLSQVLSRPMRSIPFQRDTLNPYIAIILTFVSTVVKSDHWSIFERIIPWGELATFLSTVPRSIIKLSDEAAGSREPSIITAGCSPLPEDACLRGMAWGGRKIYERGFWNRAADGRINEAAVLDVKEGEEVSDGIIEDDDDDDDSKGKSPHTSDQDNRWIRVLRSGMRITKYVDGFTCTPQPNGKRVWSVEGRLAERVESWKEQRRREHEEEDMRRIRRRWDDSMDVDEEPAEDGSEESDADDENDSEEVKTLKVRLFSVIILWIAIDLSLLRSDAVTSAVSYNLRTINPAPLPSHPDAHRAPRSPRQSQQISSFQVTLSSSSTQTSCYHLSQCLPLSWRVSVGR